MNNKKFITNHDFLSYFRKPHGVFIVLVSLGILSWALWTISVSR